MAVTGLTLSVPRPRGRALDRRHVHRHTDRDELRDGGPAACYEDYGQEISSDIPPGASSEGIIVFSPINRAGKFRVILAGYNGGDLPPARSAGSGRTRDVALGCVPPHATGVPNGYHLSYIPRRAERSRLAGLSAT